LKTIFEHLVDHLRSNLGMYEKKLVPDLESLRETEQSPEFRTLKDARLIMGAFRYGLLGKNTRKFERVKNAIKRLQSYLDDGNKEHLLDAANICEIEWIEENQSNAHYRPADDVAIHCSEYFRESPNGEKC